MRVKKTCVTKVAYAPSISISPCAMLMTRMNPNVMASPSADSSKMLPVLMP